MMKDLLTFLKPFKKQCVIGPICKLIEAILEIFLPTIMAFMINEGIVKQDMQVVVTLGITMVVMVIIGFGFSITCQYNAALASQGFGTNLRNHMFQHIAAFSYQDIDHFTTLSLSNRLTNDINQMQIAVAMLIRLVIRSPFIIIGTIVVSMFLDFQLSIILIASMPLIVLILYVFIQKSIPLYRMYQKKLDRLANLLDDHLSGVRVIRSFVTQHREKKRFDASCDDLQNTMMRVSRLSALLNPFTALVVNGAIMFLLYVGVIQIGDAHMPPGNVIAFINYAAQILLALIAISNLIVIFTKASASASRIQEVLAFIPSMKEGTNTYRNNSAQAIEFQQVSFQYGSGEEALTDLTFTINHGETIGIIGGTGSGKSTLAHLICRFYDCTKGTIRIFDHLIQDYNFASLYQRITIVPQSNELFKGSIRDNVLFGYDSASETEVIKALQDAQAYDFVMAQPEGIDTLLERGGTNLSGGQRQRLCIARALLRKSDILILDDSSSALDFHTDAALRHALKTYKKTLIIISQRVGTIAHADRILVLDDGKQVGFATHQQLYEQCSVYHEICETQQIGRDEA